MNHVVYAQAVSKVARIQYKRGRNSSTDGQHPATRGCNYATEVLADASTLKRIFRSAVRGERRCIKSGLGGWLRWGARTHEKGEIADDFSFFHFNLPN